MRCAPDTDPTPRMIATKAAPVTTAFSNSSRPTSPGLSREAAIPEPMTAITKNAVPMNSARARRLSEAATEILHARQFEVDARLGTPSCG